MTVFFQSPLVCRTKVSPSCLSKTRRPRPAFVRSSVRLVALRWRGRVKGLCLISGGHGPQPSLSEGLPIFTPCKHLPSPERDEERRQQNNGEALSAATPRVFQPPPVTQGRWQVTWEEPEESLSQLLLAFHMLLFLGCLFDSPTSAWHTTEIVISCQTGLHHSFFCFLFLFACVQLLPHDKKAFVPVVDTHFFSLLTFLISWSPSTFSDNTKQHAEATRALERRRFKCESREIIGFIDMGAFSFQQNSLTINITHVESCKIKKVYDPTYTYSLRAHTIKL